MICEKKTNKYPNGRTGTEAGDMAHRYAKEEPCEACLEARNRAAKLRSLEKTLTAPWRQPYTMERACDERTSKFPKGKRGTTAGFNTHKRMNDEPCPECLEAEREEGRRWTKETYDKYKDKKLAYQAKYREENREKIREWSREYYKANPGKNTESWRRRKARKKALPTEKYSEKDITRLYGSVCYLCAEPVDLELEKGPLRRNVEHLIPISHPDCPGDILRNVRWSHEKCNLRKGKRTPEEVTHLFPNMINPYEKEELWHAEEKLSQVV